MTKYRAVPTFVDGIRFASKREAERYGELKLLERAKEISKLELQPEFNCIVNSKKVCKYVADFTYVANNRRVIEDVKSPATAKNRAYRIKKKLVEALFPGTKITEVT